MLNPPLMVYNTENGAAPHFRNYQINHKFQEKDSGYYCWKLRKHTSQPSKNPKIVLKLSKTGKCPKTVLKFGKIS